MPKFRYTGDVERIFPGDGTRPGFHASPGDEIEADANPNEQFFEEIAPQKTAKSEDVKPDA
jgi:hypothetical protein